MPSAEKLLELMRRKRDGYGPEDFEKLYTWYGFEKNDKRGGHTYYRHPDFPELRASVWRHPVLTPGYAVDAVKLVDRLLELQAEALAAENGINEGNNNENA